MPAPTQTRKIIISVDSKGAANIKDIADKLGGINKNTKELAKGFNTLGAATSTFLGGLSIRTIAGFSDEIQNLNNRLLAMSGSQVEASSTLGDLTKVARETNQSLNGISESYFRMSLALKDANISQATLIDLTKTIANTFRLSGASTQEATNATIQLGQAFSLGVLRGQDLRSVMSQNVTLTRLLRQEFGNNLLKSAEQGLITVPKLMEILAKNMKTVNDQAKLMSATFEQSTVKALDAFKLKIFEVSSALDLPGKFAKGMTFAINNMGALTTAAAILAFGTMPGLIASFYTFAASLGLVNPLILATAAALAAVVGAFGDSFDVTDLVVQLEVGFSRLRAKYDDFVAYILEVRSKITFLTSDKMTESFKNQAAALRQSAKDFEVHAQAVRLEYEANKELAKTQKNGGDAAKRWAEDIEKAKKAFQPDLTVQQMLAELNRSFLDGATNVADYNEKILDFNEKAAIKKFKDGKINLDQLNEAFKKVEIFRVNRQFAEGALTIDEFNKKVSEIKLKALRDDLEAGRISLVEFNSKVASLSDEFSAGGALRTGLQDYVTSIGTTTQQVAGLIKSTFSELEDVFMGFIKNGKFEFSKFTQAILDDLTRIIIRASIIRPIANGILGALNSPSTTNTTATNADYSNVAAKGAYFDRGGVSKFAAGGIVSAPTLFGYGRGKTGLMGEAGPEAILPLKRSGGELGVAASVTPVNITIINQSGNEVQQKETMGPNGERSIEVLITNKVREGITNGQYDKALKGSFGLNRKGS